MKSSQRTTILLGAGALAALLLLGACAKTPDDGAIEQAKDVLPPAIIAPADVADTGVPPSYEVGIAAAAADRNSAKEKCAEKTERLRAICEAEVDAAFADKQVNLEDLRGNQQ